MEIPYIQIAIIFSKLLFFLPKRNPAKIQEKHYEKYRGKIDIIIKKQKSKTEDAQMASENPKLLNLAKIFTAKANRRWGKSRINDYKAAWYNVLAAESYQAANSHSHAGFSFHWAAHGFRNLGEYAVAGRYYYNSAEQFRNANDDKMAMRACQRGIACFKEVCDESDETYNQLIKLKKNIGQQV